MDPKFNAALTQVLSKADSYMSFRVNNLDYTMASTLDGRIVLKLPGGHSETMSPRAARDFLEKAGAPSHVRVLRRKGPGSVEAKEFRKLPGGYVESAYEKNTRPGFQSMSYMSSSSFRYP